MDQSLNTKNPVGAPKKENPKKHLGLRLSKEVIEHIRKQPNQVAYIERLVLADKAL